MKLFLKIFPLIFLMMVSSSVCQSETSSKTDIRQFVILKADDLVHDKVNVISKNWVQIS
ncbi:MAG: hypothetical protein M5T52_01695 [Ignavibacteriaceae bacterium]|nr:hypothetical protein [Ignavibacteriaceae bacterium]